MSDYRVVADFTGYPGGRRRDFKAGASVRVSREIDQEYADLLVSKGHIEPVKPKKEEPK